MSQTANRSRLETPVRNTVEILFKLHFTVATEEQYQHIFSELHNASLVSSFKRYTYQATLVCRNVCIYDQTHM